MKTLEEVRVVFPTANYPPKDGCRKCGGEGMFKHSKTGDRLHPCMCIFVDHSIVDEAMDALRTTVNQIRNDPAEMQKMVDGALNAVRVITRGEKKQ